jgi:alpha,alpha-trehalase
LFKKDFDKQELYEKLAQNRKVAILKYCWAEEDKVFNDYNFVTKSANKVVSIATVYPLFFGLATQQQADQVAYTIETNFLKEGGVVTTLVTSGEQWDAPNGWAPMHWLAVIGLEKYGHIDLAKTIASRWLKTNESVFQTDHKMTEKYNVVDPSFPGGGGNYENQDGFGWTNGVALALHAWLKVS